MLIIDKVCEQRYRSFKIQWHVSPIIVRSIPKDLIKKINFIKLIKSFMLQHSVRHKYPILFNELNLCYSSPVVLKQMNQIIKYFAQQEGLNINLFDMYAYNIYKNLDNIFVDGCFLQIIGGIQYEFNSVVNDVSSKLKFLYQKEYKNFYDFVVSKYSTMDNKSQTIIYETQDKEFIVLDKNKEFFKAVPTDVWGMASVCLLPPSRLNHEVFFKKIVYTQTYFDIYDFSCSNFRNSLLLLLQEHSVDKDDLTNIFIVCQDLGLILYFLSVIFDFDLCTHIIDKLRVDDLFLGWNPSISFVNFVFESFKPALYLDISDLPQIYMMLAV